MRGSTAKRAGKISSKRKLTDFTLDEIEVLNLPGNLKKRATHVSEEQARVMKFKEGLASNMSAEELGRLLAESHESSSRNFENSCDELDFLAENLNNHSAVLGARLTGGGFGGAVMAWTRSSFDEKDAKALLINISKNLATGSTIIISFLPMVPVKRIYSKSSRF